MTVTALPIILPLSGVVALLAVAALHDLAFRTVPNRLTAAIAGMSLTLRAVEHQLSGALLASLLIFALCILCWLLGWLGGGDVKLLPAAALAIAPSHLATYLLAVTIAGGVLALLYLALGAVIRRTAGSARPGRPRPARLLRRVLRAETWRIRHARSIPYACAIAAGVLVTLVQVGAA